MQQYAAAQGWKSVRVSELQRWSKGVEGAVNGCVWMRLTAGCREGAQPDDIWNRALDFRALLQLKLQEKGNAGVREDVLERCEAAGIRYLIMYTNDSNVGTQSSQTGRTKAASSEQS